MALMKKTSSPESAQGKPAAKAKPPVQAQTPKDDILVPLEKEPATVSRQRGFISDNRAALMRLQLQIADSLRKRVLAPDLSLDYPLDRSEKREAQALQHIEQLISGGRLKVPPIISKEAFLANILNEIFGLGPLEALIARDDISEIMVNGPYIIFVERDGQIVESGHKFLDDDHVERIVKRIVYPLGRLADSENPLVDARLPDGSRVNAVMRPCALDGPNMSIRKFKKDKLGIEDLINFKSLTPEMASFIEAIVVARQNIVVSGGTGSGKTTLINCLSGYIPEHERTVTIEDAAELQFKQRNVVRLETKNQPRKNPPK